MSPRDPQSRGNSAILSVLFFAGCWCYLFFGYRYHLVFKEQIALFVSDPSFVQAYFHKPACLALIAGDFLTQFFLLGGAAVTITLLAVALLWDGIRRFFRHERIENAALCALLPAAAETALCCQLEHPLGMTLGAAMAVWAVLGCISIDNDKVRRIAEFLLILIAYPAVGAHALLAALLLPIGEWRRDKVAAVLLPCLSIAAVLLQTHIYRFTIAQGITYPVIQGYLLQTPFIFTITGAALLLGWLAGVTRLKAVPTAVLVACIAVGGLWWARDAREEGDLKVSTLAYFGRWGGVSKMGRTDKFKSQTIAYYTNIAEARNGRLADKLLDRYQPLFYGLFLPVDGSAGYPKVMASVDALLLCGDYAQAQHSAMLAMNFTPRQTSSRMMRKLAETAVCNADTLAARKYLGILKKTIFHSSWARSTEELLGSGVVLNNLRDTMYIVNDFRSSLLSVLETNPAMSPTVDYLLCFDLLQKNILGFKEDYDRFYLPLHVGTEPPRIYQEALEMLEAEPVYGVSDRVKADNQDFLSGNEARYRHSYWFYFKYAESGE